MSFPIIDAVKVYLETKIVKLNETNAVLMLLDDCISPDDAESLNVEYLDLNGGAYFGDHAYKGLGLVRRCLKRLGTNPFQRIIVAHSKYLALNNFEAIDDILDKDQNLSLIVVAHPYSGKDRLSFSPLKACLSHRWAGNKGKRILNIASIGHTVSHGIRYPASIPDFLSVGVHDSDGKIVEQCPLNYELKQPQICVENNEYILDEYFSEYGNFAGTSAAVNILASVAVSLHKAIVPKDALALKAALLCLTRESGNFYQLLCRNIGELINKGDFLFPTPVSHREFNIKLNEKFNSRKLAVVTELGNFHYLWSPPPPIIKLSVVCSGKSYKKSERSWLFFDLSDVDVDVEINVLIEGYFSSVTACIFKDK